MAQLSQDELVRPVCSLRDELAGLRDENAVLREELAAVRSENAVLRGELAAVRGENAVLRGELAAVRGENAVLRDKSRRRSQPANRHAAVEFNSRDVAVHSNLNIVDAARAKFNRDTAGTWLATGFACLIRHCQDSR